MDRNGLSPSCKQIIFKLSFIRWRYTTSYMNAAARNYNITNSIVILCNYTLLYPTIEFWICNMGESVASVVYILIHILPIHLYIPGNKTNRKNISVNLKAAFFLNRLTNKSNFSANEQTRSPPSPCGNVGASWKVSPPSYQLCNIKMSNKWTYNYLHIK